METSDIKDFLKGKVASSGIVNTDRAMMAAKLSLTMQLDQALSSARVQINDVSTQSFSNVKAADEAFVLPLPSLL